MRAITFTMRHDGTFHPLCHAREELPFTRERIHQFTVLNDGTAVILRRISGHLDKARRAIEVHPNTVSYSVSGDSEGDGLAYVHTEPPESIAAVIDLPHEHEVVFDFPLEGIDAGTIRASMIGETNATLRQALAAIPEEITVTVERIGAYPADASDRSRLLTDRQRELLGVAVELGYYDAPRQATHDDIADRVGLAASTVSEHMQKIEARTFAALVE